jgi:hypothetical protein
MSGADERQVFRARRDEVAALAQSYPRAALNEARTIAEAVCHSALQRTTSIDPKNTTLDNLVTLLEKNGVLPRHLEPALRTIQMYGNFGSHHQRLDGVDDTSVERTQAHFVKSTIEALDLVLDWYGARFVGGAPLVPQEGEEGASASKIAAAPAHAVAAGLRGAALRGYLEALQRKLRAREAGYIDVAASFRDGRPMSAATWSADASALVTYVTGEFGCGKTAFCASLLSSVCREQLALPMPTLVPVLVNVTDLDLEPDALAEIAAERHDALRSLLRLTPPVVKVPAEASLVHLVLYDGLDEIEIPVAEALIAKVLEIAVAHGGAIRFALASRINALRLYSQNLNDQGVPGQAYLPAKSNTVALSHFGESERAAFLESRITDGAHRERTLRFLAVHPNLSELASRPLTLSLLTHAPMGEPSVLDSFITAKTSDSGFTLTAVFDAVVRRTWQRLARSEHHDVELYAAVLGRLAYGQLDNPVLATETIAAELKTLGVPRAQRANVAHALVSATFLSAHPTLPDRHVFQVRAFRDYFIASELRNLERMRAAVTRFAGRLQPTFCRRGIVDFLRDMMQAEHKGYLTSLLEGTDDEKVFASHLLRSSTFADTLEALERALLRCSDLTGRIFLVFAILSHVRPDDPRITSHSAFLEENATAFRDALKLFVDGVERDVLAFSCERLNVRQHRAKAVLYLLSLRDPDVCSVDPTRVREAVTLFEAGGVATAFEASLVRQVLSAM